MMQLLFGGKLGQAIVDQRREGKRGRTAVCPPSHLFCKKGKRKREKKHNKDRGKKGTTYLIVRLGKGKS